MSDDGGTDLSDLGGATGADAPGATERTRLGELYGEVPQDATHAVGTPPVTVTQPTTSDAPLVRVVRGEPDAIELAALIAGLSAAAAASVVQESPEVVRHRWQDRSHALRGGSRGLPARGGNAWRWSLHP